MDDLTLQLPQRVTAVFLDVVAYLLDHPGAHGYAIWNDTRNRSATVYSVLANLVNAGWVSSEWIDHRRQCYTLTPDASDQVRRLLSARRPTPNQRQAA